jgi:hypothetical protein
MTFICQLPSCPSTPVNTPLERSAVRGSESPDQP